MKKKLSFKDYENMSYTLANFGYLKKCIKFQNELIGWLAITLIVYSFVLLALLLRI